MTGRAGTAASQRWSVTSPWTSPALSAAMPKRTSTSRSSAVPSSTGRHHGRARGCASPEHDRGRLEVGGGCVAHGAVGQERHGHLPGDRTVGPHRHGGAARGAVGVVAAALDEVHVRGSDQLEHERLDVHLDRERDARLARIRLRVDRQAGRQAGHGGDGDIRHSSRSRHHRHRHGVDDVRGRYDAVARHSLVRERDARGRVEQGAPQDLDLLARVEGHVVAKPGCHRGGRSRRRLPAPTSPRRASPWSAWRWPRSTPRRRPRCSRHGP